MQEMASRTIVGISLIGMIDGKKTRDVSVDWDLGGMIRHQLFSASHNQKH